MTIGECIHRLRDAFPRESFSDASMRVYAQDLADLPDELVSDAVTRLIRIEVRRPTVAQIRRDVAEAIADLPDASEAWDMANRGTSGGIDEVRQAIASVGGTWTIKHTENPTTLRAQFEKDYNRRRETAIRTLAGASYVSNRTLLPAPESIHSRTVEAIPESTRIRPRPVMMRLSRRYAGMIVPRLSPSLDERSPVVSDAIRILWEGATSPDDPLWIEAHRVMDEASTL